MPKHKTYYVFLVSDNYHNEKLIIHGRNEKEARRNLQDIDLYLEFECPKIELLSCHPTFLKALEWRVNNAR